MTQPRSSPAWAILSIAALALSACADASKTAAGPTVRLIDRLGQAELVGGRPAAPPPATRPSRVLRPRDRDHLGRVALAHAGGDVDERLAILVAAGTRLRLPVAAMGRSRLRLGLGRLIGGPDGSAAAADPAGDQPVRAIARLIEDGRAATILERALATSHWNDVEVDVSLAGPATIELAAAGPAGTWIAWSSPELIGRRAPGWDLILISLDTLRADHLGAYGYERPTSPHLDAFAAGAYRFARAFSPAPWTLPSHQSLFNGLYPQSHGDLRSPPLARVLWRAGYRTEARTGGGVMDYRMGTLAQGFDSYRYHDWIRDLDTLAGALATSDDRRRFLFLHTYEPHDPYIDTRFAAALPGGRVDGYFDKGLYPPIRDTISEEERRYVEALYDGDIAYTDEQLGDLFTRLAADGTLERSIVAIVSDHGEQFWEHGSWRHGQNLYDEQIHVPLILRLPARLRRELGLPAAAVIEDQVRLIDLYPTLLELLGLPLAKPVQGRSLVPLLAGEELQPAEALAEDLNLAATDSKAVRYRGFKFLRTLSIDPRQPNEVLELYDLRRDPAERSNLIASRPEVAAELRALLEQLAGGDWTGEGEPLAADDLDPDLRRDLEALGYIGND